MRRESYIIIAPDGRQCHWTRSPYPARAIFKLLAGRIGLWPYAQEHGYRCRPYTAELDPLPDMKYLYARVAPHYSPQP